MSYSTNFNEKETNTGKLWVVLVGVNTYQVKTIRKLNYCADDCRELAEILTIANKEQQTEIIALYDGGEKQPTRNEVIRSIQKFGSAKPEDTILFYFAGHGYLDSNNQPILCFADTQINDLASTTLSINTLLSKFRESPAKNQLIWLDACQEEVTDKLITVFEQQAQQSRAGQNFYAILSCDKTQRSWEFSELKHGVFTYYLIEGLRGKAANSQGYIEVEELFNYASSQISKFIEYRKNPLDSSNSRNLISRGLVSNPANAVQPVTNDFPSDEYQNPRKIVYTSGDTPIIGFIGSASIPSQRQALVIDRLSASQNDLNLCKILQARGGFQVNYCFLQASQPQNIERVIINYLQNNNTKTLLLYLSGIIKQSDRFNLSITPQHSIDLNWLGKQLQSSTVQEIVIITNLVTSTKFNLAKILKPNNKKSICLINAVSNKLDNSQFIQQLINILNNVRQQRFWASELITELQFWSKEKTDINLNLWLSGTTEVMEILLPEVQRSHNEVFEINICPFKSLKSFDVDDAYFFHGREALIQEIINKLSSTSFLAVVGASGSGKSSVVKAGVVPQLISQRLFTSEAEFQSCKTWIIRPTDLLQPQNDNILAALANQLQSDNRELIEGILHLGVDSFVGWLKQQPQSISVLVIDQFEELFTASAIDKNNFLDLIIGATSQTGDRFKVIITLRDDFLQECLAMSQLAHLIAQNNVLVPSCLDEEDYRQIITQPAKKVGLEVEHELVNLLLQQLEAGSLPLLQFVLEELYIKRSNGCLTLSIYQQEICELRSILGQKAQETYNKLNSEQQECAKWIFLSLVQLGEGTEDTRRRLQISELIVDKYRDVFDATLQTLIEARLLVVSRETTFPTPKALPYQEKEDKPEEDSNSDREDIVTVEVAHEILIRNWDTLRWWLQENRSKMRSIRELQQKTDEWEQTHSSQKDGFLLSEAALAKYEEFYINNPDELPTRVHQFMGLSIEKRDRLKEADRKRLEREIKLRKTAQRRAKFLAIALLVALFVTGIATWQWQKALVNQINTDIATSETLLASDNYLDALVARLRAGKRGKKVWKLDRETRMKIIGALHDIYSVIKESNRLEGHTDRVTDFQLSPDGQIIASISGNTINLWNLQGKLLHSFKNDSYSYFQQVIFSPDGKTFITVSYDETIKLWNLQGKLLHSFKSRSSEILKIFFRPDGKLIAFINNDGTIDLWDLQGKLVRSFKNHLSEIYKEIASSPDKKIIFAGRILIFASNNKTIKLWNLEDKTVLTLIAHTNSVNYIKLSPDGKTFASTSNDGTIKLWSLEGKLLNTITDSVEKIKFSPDGKKIVTVTDKKIKLWNTNGQLLAEINQYPFSEIANISFSSDGQFLAYYGNDNDNIGIWNIDKNSGDVNPFILSAHKDDVIKIEFTSQGLTLISASNDKTLKIWNLEKFYKRIKLTSFQKELSRKVPTQNKKNIKSTISSFGSFLVSYYVPNKMISINEKSDLPIQLWKVKGNLTKELNKVISGEPNLNNLLNSNVEFELVANLSNRTYGFPTIIFNKNEKVVAIASWDKTIKIYKTKGELLHTYVLTDNISVGIKQMQFSPNQKILAVADGNEVKLWNFEGKLLKTLKSKANSINEIQFSPDGKTLAVIYQSTIELWNTNGKLLHTLNHSGFITKIAFSPDGKKFVTSTSDYRQSKNINLWNINGKLLHTLNHPGTIIEIAFSPNGKMFVTSSGGINTIWNINGKLIYTISSPDTINLNTNPHLQFSSNGKILISSNNQGIKLLSLDLDDVLTRGCDWARDYLTNNPNVSESDRHICDGI